MPLKLERDARFQTASYEFEVLMALADTDQALRTPGFVDRRQRV
jgi:hypothetical protein